MAFELTNDIITNVTFYSQETELLFFSLDTFAQLWM